MPQIVRHRRRINGESGPPEVGGALEGELVLNFPGPAGSEEPAEAWAFDGVAFRSLTSSGGGSSVEFATQQETKDGEATDLAVNPAGLSSIFPPEVMNAGTTVTIADIASSSDANKIVILNANGQIPAQLLPISGFTFQVADLTLPPEGPASSPVAGMVVINNAASEGPINEDWGIEGNPVVQPKDMVLYDGYDWYIIEGNINMDSFVTLSGAEFYAGARLSWPVDGSSPDTVIIDGGDSVNSIAKNLTIDESVIDGGTY